MSQIYRETPTAPISTHRYSDHYFKLTEDGPLILDEIRLQPKEVIAGVLLDASGEPVSDRIIAMTFARWRGFIVWYRQRWAALIAALPGLYPSSTRAATG